MILGLTDDQLYRICCKRDARYDGVFFFGAKDSEVYCCPSCGARTPIREKIQYYATREEAEALGHRPCKRCCPDKIEMKDLETFWVRLP